MVFPQGNTASSLHVDPSIALDGSGVPLVAATYGETAPSGSLQYSQLRLNRRVGGGSWSSEVVADSSDGFSGSDGPQFTGWNPLLVLTGDGRALMLFSDLACWHEGGSQHCQRGQIRLAVGEGGGWALTTLYGQSVNPQSYLHRLRLDAVVECRDAAGLSVFAYEGSPANSGWTGSFTHLRWLASEALLLADGFETGDTGGWSVVVPGG